MHRAFAIALVFLAFFLAPRARADDASTVEELRAFDGGAALLSTTVVTPAGGGKRKATVKLQPLDDKMANVGAPVVVHDGALVGTTLAVRPGFAGVLLFRGGAGAFAKLAIVDLDKGKIKTVDLPRTAPAGYGPTTAVACADADGFTVLWQEQGEAVGAVHSTMARVKTNGDVVMKPTSVAIPWSLGAIIDDGRGFTLAVRYDGQTPDQTRICFVTLTYAGGPEQHPWWGAKPAQVADLQLAMLAGIVQAIYRDVGKGGSVLTVPADKAAGQWGKDPPASKSLTVKNAGAPFGVKVKNGALVIVQK